MSARRSYGAIGLERQFHGKASGARTSILICLGTSLFVAMGATAAPDRTDPTRVLGQVVTGIGFLGAGVIIRDAAGTSVHGLTTSALVWLVAALGILCGIGAWPPALLGTGITLLIIVIGRPLERIIHNRFPALTENNHDNRDQHR
jgi:putative Mg2+ transporter-C (MgtC) family protein